MSPDRDKLAELANICAGHAAGTLAMLLDTVLLTEVAASCATCRRAGRSRRCFPRDQRVAADLRRPARRVPGQGGAAALGRRGRRRASQRVAGKERELRGRVDRGPGRAGQHRGVGRRERARADARRDARCPPFRAPATRAQGELDLPELTRFEPELRVVAKVVLARARRPAAHPLRADARRRDDRLTTAAAAAMDRERLYALLERFARAASCRARTCVEALAVAPFVELGDARVDTHRALRAGVPEVVLGTGKTVDQIARIARALAASGENVLVTRARARAGGGAVRAGPRLRVSRGAAAGGPAPGAGRAARARRDRGGVGGDLRPRRSPRKPRSWPSCSATRSSASTTRASPGCTGCWRRSSSAPARAS